MTILLVREVLGTNYRDTVDLVELLEPIRDLLQLERVPHYSTIHKFMTRIPSVIFTRMLKKTLLRFLFNRRYNPPNGHRCFRVHQRVCQSLLLLENG